MNKLKQLTIGLAIALVSIVAPNANAGSGQLDTALGQIYVSSNPAQEWKAAGMHGFVGNSGRIRFKQKSISLYNITPPSFSAGCNGISWNLGGLSFIDGEELIEFLQATGQAMAGQIILLAAKTICEPCTTTLETIQEWAQKAAMDGINSCNVAKSLVGKLENTSAVKDMKTSMSGFWDSMDGGTDDYMSGLKKFAEFPQKINKGFRDFLENDPAKKEENATQLPNYTWYLLRESGFVPDASTDSMSTSSTGLTTDENERLAWAEIVMSLVGTGNESESQHVPTLTIDDVYDFVVCGAKDTPWDTETVAWGGMSSMKAHCQKVWDAKGDKPSVLTCSDNGSGVSNYGKCWFETGSEGEKVTLTQVSLFNPNGKDVWIGHTIYKTPMMDKVAHSLKLALKNIDENKPPYDSNDFLLTILKVTPFDLYRVLNVASASPQTSEHLLQKSVVLISTLMAGEYLEMALKVNGLGNKKSSTGTSVGLGVRKEMRYSLAELLVNPDEKSPDAKKKALFEDVSTEIHYQTLVMDIVRTVEKRVSIDATTRQMNGARKWSSSPLPRKSHN